MKWLGRQEPTTDAAGLQDLKLWQRRGAAYGVQNIPTSPDADSPLRSALQVALTSGGQQAREQYVQDTRNLDQRRQQLRRQLAETHTLTGSNPRLASNAGPLNEAIHTADQERQQLHARLESRLELLLTQAQTCDLAWRQGNQQARDRRISIAATALQLSPELAEAVDDPLA